MRAQRENFLVPAARSAKKFLGSEVLFGSSRKFFWSFCAQLGSFFNFPRVARKFFLHSTIARKVLSRNFFWIFAARKFFGLSALGAEFFYLSREAWNFLGLSAHSA